MAILLSTYNGERFLPEQLGSYGTQTHTDWRLYWRDDGSSDNSPAVVEAFAHGPGLGRCERHPALGRLFAPASFLALLRLAVRGPADFFAFSDQDDVWLPEKLAHGVAALPPDRPGLYFCARTLTDAALRPIGTVGPPVRAPGFPAALTQNLAPGCCMILNRAAAQAIAASREPEGTWHDWWSYLVVSVLDGRIVPGGTPDILYRQHGANLIGEPSGFWSRAAAAVQRGRGPFMADLWRQVRALQALTGGHREDLAVIAEAGDGGMAARLRALRLPGFVRQRPLETLLFRMWFLLG